MIAGRQPRTFTVDEYLELEERSDSRSEFIRGGIYAMVGGTADHANLIMRTGAALIAGLAGQPCRVMNSDFKLYVPAAGISVYPDVSVYCRPMEFYRDRRDVGLNPRAVVEVLSPSTAAFERGEKWEGYQTIPSLKEYILVASNKARVEVYTRQADGSWALRVFEGAGATAHLVNLGVDLSLSTLYADLEPS